MSKQCQIPPGFKDTARKPFRIDVVGNIGCGKSTLISCLKKCFESKFVDFIPEPVNEWINISGENLLEEYYKDPVKYFFPFQIYSTLTKDRLIKKSAGHIQFIERSWISNQKCFLEMGEKMGYVSSLEKNILNEFYEHYQSNKDIDLILYLKTSTDTAWGRCKKRGRESESELKYSYLKDLQDIHDTSFIESEKCSIVVDANIDFENDEIKLNNIIDQIFENVPYLKYFHIHHKINKFEYNNSVQNI